MKGTAVLLESVVLGPTATDPTRGTWAAAATESLRRDRRRQRVWLPSAQPHTSF